MRLQELKDALRTVDPAAVLVSHRLLARVIREVHRLPTQFLQVPHHRSFVIDRQMLFRHVEQDELDLDPDRLLPPTVLLLVRPSAENGAVPNRTSTLLKYWQQLFHASVDRALDQQIKAGKLTAADIRARVAAIGHAEFDEIGAVLGRELCLLPPVDDQVVYCEFVAVYLELKHFLPNLRSVYFPSLGDLSRIDKVVGQDIDGEALWKATRLHGAPDPMVQSDNRSDDSHEYYWRLVRDAESASTAGNQVRGAILRTKAARVAPGALTHKTRNDANHEIHRLAGRMQAALQLSEADATAWHAALVSLLEKADQGPWTVEARLLYDLQQVCIDAEREVYKLDLVEWLLSAFKRPIKRPLPSQRLVQMTRHLRAAAQRIPLARLSDNDRQHLTGLLQAALHHTEQRLRTEFRPFFAGALHDVGLVATNPPEETALRKLIEELLDRITAAGFCTFSDLRDVISRNSLKLNDLADPEEFVRGDPLLRLDRRLATQFDGVYRSGEVYLRVLSRSTSLMYGTRAGRFITRNVLLPFGVPFVTLYGLDHFIREEFPKGLGLHFTIWPMWSFFPVGLIVLGLMHLKDLRRSCVKGLQAVGEGLRLIVQGPIWLVRLPAVQRIWRSWLFQLCWWYALKPLMFALCVWPFLPEIQHPWLEFGITFVIVVVMLNSQLGHAASEIIAQGVLDLYDKLRSGLIPGLVRFVMQLLKQAMDGLERLLYSIDEWLRFRTGDTPASMVARAVLGVIWYPISFFTRLYVVVLIEPMFHPLKLPIAILAAKFLYPLGFTQLTDLQVGWLQGLIGTTAATVVAVVNTWLLPDLFGFLFWELRENWRLYRANRSPVLKPVMVGQHGETMVQLLKPGFHSGTVPRLFDQLRRAERLAMTSGQWRTARAYRHQLQELEEGVRLFVERELLVLLHQSRTWQDKPLRTGKIQLATHLIRIELEHNGHPGEPVRWAFAEQSGWLTVQVEHPGWLTKLPMPQLGALTTALAGWYKLAGVTVVREQVQAGLAGSGWTYAVETEGLALRPAERLAEEVVCPMYDTVRLQLHRPSKDGAVTPLVPPVESLVFARMPIFWEAWVEAWLRDLRGQTQQLLPAGVELLPVKVGTQAGVDHAERNGKGAGPNLGAMPAPGGG